MLVELSGNCFICEMSCTVFTLANAARAVNAEPKKYVRSDLRLTHRGPAVPNSQVQGERGDWVQSSTRTRTEDVID